jgi:hypothetical protein
MEMKQGELCVSSSNMKIFKFAQKCYIANLCVRNSERYSGFHVRCPIFLSDLKKKIGASRQIFIKVPIIKFYLNPSSGILAVTCGWADEQIDRQADR